MSQPAVGIVTTEPQKESESLARPPTAQQQPTERMGRSEMVMYVQRRLCPKVTGTRCPRETQGPHPLLSDYTGPPQLQALKAKARLPSEMPSRRRPRPVGTGPAGHGSRSPSSAIVPGVSQGQQETRAVGDVPVSPQCVTCTSLA